MTVDQRIAGLIQLRHDHDHIEWRNDMDRAAAEHRWLMESVVVLLMAAARTPTLTQPKDD